MVINARARHSGRRNCRTTPLNTIADIPAVSSQERRSNAPARNGPGELTNCKQFSFSIEKNAATVGIPIIQWKRMYSVWNTTKRSHCEPVPFKGKPPARAAGGVKRAAKNKLSEMVMPAENE